MPIPLRFTGQNPPIELWGRYPNWRNAYEEEGVEGQDETTLMPHEEQTYIGPHTSFTTGKVRFNDGREFPAFIAIGKNRIDGCQVYEASIPWRIFYNYPQKKWVSFRAEWLPQSERPWCVTFEDAAIFPLEVLLSVPWAPGERPKRYRIETSGQIVEITDQK